MFDAEAETLVNNLSSGLIATHDSIYTKAIKNIEGER